MLHRVGYTAYDVCRWLGYPAPQKIGQGALKGFCIDTRRDCEGYVFVGVKGKNCDGSKYYRKAFEKGALMAIVNASYKRSPSYGAQIVDGRPLLVVPDTLFALKKCAQKRLKDLKDALVVAITGSCGKTTTKEILYTVLKERFKTVKAPESYNNAIGVSLTVLSAPADTEVLILEFGTNAPGEIASLCSIARPYISVLTAVGPAHLEGLGSIEGVFKEKTDIIRHTLCGGIAVLNADAVDVERTPNPPRGRKIIVSTKRTDVDLYAEGVRKSNGSIFFRLNGYEGCIKTEVEHFLSDALCAISVAEVLGIPRAQILNTLKNFNTVRMRMEELSTDTIKIINDSYNANPLSVRASIDHLSGLSKYKRRIFVLGDMLELGRMSESLHRQVGEYTASKGIDVLITVGEKSALAASAAQNAGMEKVFKFRETDEAGEFLQGLVSPGDVVLLKASRKIRLESVIDGLLCRKNGEGTTDKVA